jgi:hypothetical protein
VKASEINLIVDALAPILREYVDNRAAAIIEQVKGLTLPKETHIPTAEEVRALIVLPTAIKGDPGEKPTADELLQLIRPLIPEPVKGDPGSSPTTEELKALIQPLIPSPVKGDRGDTPTQDELKALIAPLIPAPIPGHTPTVEEIKALIPAPIPGRDALDFNPLPAIDEAKSYPRNTYALHKGGIWRAYDTTAGMRGWECIVCGVDSIDLEQVDERTFTLKVATSKEVIEKAVKVPTIIDRGVYRDAEKYEPGDAVTFGGSVWIAQKHATTYGKPGEMGSGWRLSVRAGRDYRDKKP